MTKDKALDLALEVLQINLTLLEKINPYKGQEDLLSDSLDLTHKAIPAIKQARSAPVQEPVAWMHEWGDGERVPMIRKRDVDSSDIDSPKSVRPLVFGDTTPPAAQRPFAGLTDEERTEIRREHYARTLPLMDAVEAKLRSKNNG